MSARDASPPPVRRDVAARTSSRQSRRPSTEGQASHRAGKRPARTANDVRVKPASPDVISDLLNSFGTIDPKSIYTPPGSPLGAQSPPAVATSRSNSRSSVARRGNSVSIRLPAQTHDFVEEVSHPTHDPTDLPAEEDAAASPVIRTARPPSGRTGSLSVSRKSERPSKSFSRQAASPRALTLEQAESPGPSRRYPSQAHSPDATEPRIRQPSKERVNIPPEIRKALDDAQSSRRNSLRATAYDSQRAASFTAPEGSTATARSSTDQARSSRRSKRREPRQNVPTSVPQRPENNFGGTFFDDEQRMSDSSDSFWIPARRSSLQSSITHSVKSFSEPTSTQNTSVSAPRDKTRKRPLRILGDDDPQPSNTVADQPAAIENEDPTERRIRELEASRLERKKSLNKNKPLPNGGMSPGISARALSPQTRPVLPLEINGDARFSSDSARGDQYTLDLPRPPTAEARPPPRITSPPISYQNRPSSLTANAWTSPRGSSRTSMDSARGTRSESKPKRKTPLRGGSKPDVGRGDDPLPSPRLRDFSIDVQRDANSVAGDVNRFLAAPRLSQTIELPGDSRRVVFSEVGDPKGFAVMCCVGMGLTRYVMAFYDELAQSLGLRLITPDRPGIGDSDSYTDGSRTPLSWPGAVYALATALRLPHYLRGTIQLLAPWIPPSQLVVDKVDAGMPQAGALPRTQRLLRVLPASFLKLGNSSLNSFGSSSSSSNSKANMPNRSASRPRQSVEAPAPAAGLNLADLPPVPAMTFSRSMTDLHGRFAQEVLPPSPLKESFMRAPEVQHSIEGLSNGHALPLALSEEAQKERQRAYDAALIPAIWDRATKNANPSVDLLICLERQRDIGFSYTEVGAKPNTNIQGERPGRIIDLGAEVDGNQWPGMGVAIRHGSKDTRVPLENVKWLGARMVNCSVRVLPGLGHGLMGEASVIGQVLGDIAKQWEDNVSWHKRRR